MRKVSLSLFVLSVIAILLALYYPERCQPATDCITVNVAVPGCDSCAVEVMSLPQNYGVAIDSIESPVAGGPIVELEVCPPENQNLSESVVKDSAF